MGCRGVLVAAAPTALPRTSGADADDVTAVATSGATAAAGAAAVDPDGGAATRMLSFVTGPDDPVPLAEAATPAGPAPPPGAALMSGGLGLIVETDGCLRAAAPAAVAVAARAASRVSETFRWSTSWYFLE